MILSVSALGQPGSCQEVHGTICLNGESIGTQHPFPEAIEVAGQAVNQGGVLWLYVTLSTVLTLLCDRCGTSFTQPYALDCSFRLSDTSVDEDSDEDVIAIIGEQALLDDALRDRILLDLPHYFICDEACAGLCHTCGVNLNETTCACSTSEHDSRWDALKDWAPAHDE